jgi:hypothetical protein
MNAIRNPHTEPTPPILGQPPWVLLEGEESETISTLSDPEEESDLPPFLNRTRAAEVP